VFADLVPATVVIVFGVLHLRLLGHMESAVAYSMVRTVASFHRLPCSVLGLGGV
jgi:hypothetical protein